jgi:ABC-2 type transport system permease protein
VSCRAIELAALRRGETVRLYVEVARSSSRRYLAYRSATLAGLFTNSVFGALLASVYIALYRDREAGATVAGFALTDLMTFVWISQSLLAVVSLWGWWEIAQSIQSGDVVSDFMKPFNYYGYWIARDAGRASAQVLMRGIPTLVIGAMLFDMRLPESGWSWLAFPASVVLAVAVSFGVRFILNVLAFWLMDVVGVNALAAAVVNLFSGMLLPLAFFPGWFESVANVLPFRSMIMSPVQAYLGQGNVAVILLGQLAWFAVLVLGGLGLLRIATKRVVVQGG